MASSFYHFQLIPYYFKTGFFKLIIFFLLSVTRDFLTVGIQNLATIANSSMTASSWKPGYYPHTARLYHSIGGGSWCAARNEQEEYLEVDLGKELTVTKISLQGHPSDGSGVTSLAIAFSRNGGYWTDYKINGARKVTCLYVLQENRGWGEMGAVEWLSLLEVWNKLHSRVGIWNMRRDTDRVAKLNISCIG